MGDRLYMIVCTGSFIVTIHLSADTHYPLPITYHLLPVTPSLPFSPSRFATDLQSCDRCYPRSSLTFHTELRSDKKADARLEVRSPIRLPNPVSSIRNKRIRVMSCVPHLPQCSRRLIRPPSEFAMLVRTVPLWETLR